MNKQKLFRRILTVDAAIVGVMMLMRILYFFISCSISRSWDSLEFIQINGFSWMSGSLDRYRLPLYPMLIELCQRILGSRALFGVGLIQLAAALAAMAALYSMLKKLTSRAYVYVPVFVLCCVSEVMMGWDKIILTESLSLSLSVLMLWALVSYLKEPKMKYIVLAVAFAGIGAFLRTVFAVYAAAIVAFLVIRLIFPGKKTPEEKKVQRVSDGKGLAVAVIPVVLLLGYGLAFFFQYGAFTVSDSGLGQQLYIVLEQGYYQDASDAEIKNDAAHILAAKTQQEIAAERRESLETLCGGELTEAEQTKLLESMKDSIQEPLLLGQKYQDVLIAGYTKLYGSAQKVEQFEPIYRARMYIMESYDRERIVAFVNEALAANRMHYLKQIPGFTHAVFNSGYTVRKSGILAEFVDMGSRLFLPTFRIALLHAILAACAELAIYLWILLRKKRSDWVHLGFGMLILATAVFALAGTNAEFARTALTAYPMLFAVFALWLDRCVTAVRNKTLSQLR